MSRIDRESIGGIIEKVVGREGFELVHWEIAGPPNRMVLRVYIDKAAGITHSDCELVSNQVGLLLDVEDLIPYHYTLEISSPGIERGLYKPSDYERFAGKIIKVKTTAAINGQKNFKGKLAGFKDNRILLELDNAGALEIPYEFVIKANLEYEN